MQKELILGQSYGSFELVDVKDCSDYKGVGYLFRHERTGMEVYFLKTDNKECFFTYTVYTPPEDNTGVFHILEHTVLTGSKRFPVRDPFMALSRNSCNTFLNAMTAPDRTDYPAASPVKKDFDNIFAIYTDAVFDPLLRKEDFMQEGIRLSSEGGLHFEGVVFSEMQGDISSHQSVVQNASTRPLFDADSPYSYEFGGNPPDITDLTYEKFLETYRKYYVPRNITLFLYGDLDVCEKLEFLDREYLRDRDGGEKALRAESPKPWTAPRKYTATSAAEEGDDSASLMVSWLLGNADNPRLNTELSLVVDVLLGNPGCPLYKKIVESKIGRDISSESGMSDAYRNLLFSVGFSGASKTDGEKGEAFILQALKEIVEVGLDPILVESSLRRMEFRLQEISDGLPEGYRIYFTRIDKGWAYGRNPSDMLQARSLVREIRKSIIEDPRYIEAWIEEKLIKNPHRLLSVIAMDESTEERERHEMETKLEKHRAEWNREEEERYLAFEEGEDTLEALQTLPRLTLSDIPSSLVKIPRTVEGNIISTPVLSNGIVYADFCFDVSDFSIEELEYVSLLSRLLLMTDVGDDDYSSFLTKLRFVTGAFSSSMDIGSDCSGKEKDLLLIRFKSLSEHFGEALDLFSRLFREGNFTSPERIKAALRDIESDYEASVKRQAHSYALGSSSRSLSSSLYTTERTQGLEFWFKVRELLSSDIRSVAGMLSEVASRTLVSSRLIFHVTADEERMAYAKKEIERFASSLPEGKKCVALSRTVPEEASLSLGYSFSSPVSYIAFSGKAPEEGSALSSSMRMLLSLSGQNSLWALIREKGGAYGAGAGLDINENIWYFYTYRDPRLDASVDDFFRSIKEEEITEEKLVDAKLRILGRDVRPMGPQVKGLLDFRRWIYGVTDELRERLKSSQLELKIEDVEGAKESMIELMKEGCLTVLAGKKSLSKSKKIVVEKALPFVSH